MTALPPTTSTTNTSIAESEPGSSVPTAGVILPIVTIMEPESSAVSAAGDETGNAYNDDGWWDDFIPEAERCKTTRSETRRSLFWQVFRATAKLFSIPARRIVSHNRRRYNADGFNLDLSYITDRIIAMGYPSKKTEVLFRNDMWATRKFLKKFHRGHFLVFNLRGEQGFMYDPKHFYYRLVQYIMADHHPPRLEYMAPLCRQMDEYLKRNPKNVVALHCKAGKGRTGVMICAYLCFIGYFDNPRQIMDYYSIIRTYDNKGVTIPSQRRYIYYFNALREHQLNYLPPRIQLIGIYIERPPIFRGSFFVEVRNTTVEIRQCQPIKFPDDERAKQQTFKRFYDDEHDENLISRRCFGWSFPKEAYHTATGQVVKPVYLEGDVRINLRAKPGILSGVDPKIGHVWFNTMFVCKGYLGFEFDDGDSKRRYNVNDPEKTMVVYEEAGPQDVAGCSAVAKAVDPSDREKKNRRIKKENVRIVPPPKFHEHCPEEVTNVERKEPIQEGIEGFLKHACKHRLIKDDCAIALSEISNRPDDEVVGRSPTSIAVSGGFRSGEEPSIVEPIQLVRDRECHYQIFSTHEIDRACKKKSLDPRCRLIVVTRCIQRVEEAKMALEEVKPKREEQFKLDMNEEIVQEKEKYEKDRSTAIQNLSVSVNEDGRSGLVNDLQLNYEEQQRVSTNRGRVDVERYSKIDPAERRLYNINDKDRDMLKALVQQDADMDRYIYRQRSSSPSRYPNAHYHCPLRQKNIEYCNSVPAEMRRIPQTDSKSQQDSCL